MQWGGERTHGYPHWVMDHGCRAGSVGRRAWWAGCPGDEEEDGSQKRGGPDGLLSRQPYLSLTLVTRARVEVSIQVSETTDAQDSRRRSICSLIICSLFINEMKNSNYFISFTFHFSWKKNLNKQSWIKTELKLCNHLKKKKKQEFGL